MAIIPKIPQRQSFMKVCTYCGISSTTDDFARTHSPFYLDGYLPICNNCINKILAENDYSWDIIDRVCQYAGIPFIVKEWARLVELNGPENTWPVYAKIFADEVYKNLGWADYNKEYIKLRECGVIEDEIPLVNERRMREFRKEWGANYDDEALHYLENLY